MMMMYVTGSKRLNWRPRLPVSCVKRRSRGHWRERLNGRAVPGIGRVVRRRRPTRGAVLRLGRPLPPFLRKAERAQEVAPEALLSVDDLVDEARLPLGLTPVGRFVGVVRGPGRRWGRRPVWGPLSGPVRRPLSGPVRRPLWGFVSVVGRDERRPGRRAGRNEWRSEMIVKMMNCRVFLGGHVRQKKKMAV